MHIHLSIHKQNIHHSHTHIKIKRFETYECSCKSIQLDLSDSHTFAFLMTLLCFTVFPWLYSVEGPRFFLRSVTDGVWVPLACLVGGTSLAAQSSTWLRRYYLNWTELDDDITEFNNEMHSDENWVLNPVILHYWHNLPILILCSALLRFVLLQALYK